METGDSKEQGANRRRLERVAFTIDMTLNAGGRVLRYDKTNDISAGGIFAVTDEPLDIDAAGAFHIKLSSGGTSGIDINGKFKVVSHSEKSGRRGMGIQFTELDADSSIALYKVVRYNQPEGE